MQINSTHVTGKRDRNGRILLLLLLVIIIILYSAPTLWMIATSFKENSRIFSKWIQWFPNPFTLENYQFAFQHYPLGRWLLNSAIVSGLVVVFTLLIDLPAGYVFARTKFRGGSLLFVLCLLSMMIPVQTYLIPLYLLFGELGLLNTYLGLVLPLLANGFGVFLFRQFITQIPVEMDEAAIIDGASRWLIVRRIVFPLCKPAIATMVIFRFMASWNDFTWPLVATSSDLVRTQSVGLALHVFGVVGANMASPRYALSMAAAFVVTLPTMIVFLLMQRYFVEGISTSGIK